MTNNKNYILELLANCPAMDKKQELEAVQQFDFLKQKYQRLLLSHPYILRKIIEILTDAETRQKIINDHFFLGNHQKTWKEKNLPLFPRHREVIQSILDSIQREKRILDDDTSTPEAVSGSQNKLEDAVNEIETLIHSLSFRFQTFVILGKDLERLTEELKQLRMKINQSNAKTKQLEDRQTLISQYESLLEKAGESDTQLSSDTKERTQIYQQYSDTRNRIAEGHIRLVYKLAVQYFPRTNIPFEDVFQAGNVGLMNAVDRYEPKRGFCFGTYLGQWVEQAIMRTCTKHEMIHTPDTVRAQQKKVMKAIQLFHNEFGRDPNYQELSQETGFSEKKLGNIPTPFSFTNIDDISI